MTSEELATLVIFAILLFILSILINARSGDTGNASESRVSAGNGENHDEYGSRRR